MASTDEHEIPKGWPAADVVQWIRSTLEEPDVKTVEIFRERGKFIVRIHYKD